ncbi:MAG: hypothetical protein DCC71_05365 [Proteobacteria bacterium]|nr:MAG: hypothetical protein DCC71_05365 [Pseudomonadota bacterium]
MPQSAIFGPFFATMLLTFAVWAFMFARRIRWITAKQISPVELAIPGRLAELSPASISNPSDNLKNLFELPVLFYAVCLYLFATQQVDGAYVTAGWIFAGFRTLHSAVHCTFNRVMVRFYMYLVAALALWFMIGRAALAHFAASPAA